MAFPETTIVKFYVGGRGDESLGEGARVLLSELIKKQSQVGKIRLKPSGNKYTSPHITFSQGTKGPIDAFTSDLTLQKFTENPREKEVKNAINQSDANLNLNLDVIDWELVENPYTQDSRKQLKEKLAEVRSEKSSVQEELQKKESKMSETQKEKESLAEELSSEKERKKELQDVCKEQKRKIEQLEEKLEEESEASETDEKFDDLFEEAGLNEPEL